MAERKFRQHIQKIGAAAQRREEVAQQMRESIILQRPPSVEPVDYETYVTKNKTILHNDPQREMLVFPHDDIVNPPPTLSKKIRTLHSTVPKSAEHEATSLMVQECIKSYTDCCKKIKFKYSQYSGGYLSLPDVKNAEPLPHQVFEIDTEADEKEEEALNKSNVTSITKTGWLYKGPDSGKGFTRQFKRRYFVLKQQSDFTYILEFYKDERKFEAKGSIFLDVAKEVVKSTKKGKYCFEVLVHDRAPYVFAAESENEMTEWIYILNKVINAAETASNISIERIREETSTPDKMEGKADNSMHPELQKYQRETDGGLTKNRQEGRQNHFRTYPNMNKFAIEEETDSSDDEEITVFPREFGERFMLQLHEFRMKLQVNLSEEGMTNKSCNPEPFFLTFSLYDAKEGRKLSEDFHMDPNEPEIRSMIPPEVLHASDKLHTVEGKDTAPQLNGLKDSWILSPNRQGLFTVVSCHSEVYLFVKIEKVLQGQLIQVLEPYMRADSSKSGSKVFKQMRQFCNCIGNYRMPFAWAAKQVISPSQGPAELPIYRHDGAKLSTADIIKHLQDFRKPDKQGKLQEIPGTFKITLHKLQPDQVLQNTLTASLVPIKPFPDPPPDPPAIEIDEFVGDKGSLCDTFDSYINNIYIYPLSLKYEHQKSFAKARNIACCIEIKDSDEDGSLPLKRIYGRPEVGVYTTVASTTVLHHVTSPEFTEEVKISLPTQVHDRHHVLFKFYHVSCEGSKSSLRSSSSSGKKKDSIETPVGYAWLPLLNNGRIIVGEHTIPVAANLPAGYLSHDVFSQGRGSGGPEIKWVDGGKHLFKVNSFLRSTIYTKEQHLHNFFYHCQRIENSPVNDVESVNRLKTDKPTLDLENTYLKNSVKSLHAVDVSTYIQFLPTILNQLFKLLGKTTCEDVAINAIKVLIHIVSEVSSEDKSQAVKKYVKYMFKPDPVPKGSKRKTVHEELARNLTSILRPAAADHVVVAKFLTHSWFFFEILIKSMTLYLIDSERIKMPRNERFPSDYQYRIQTLLQTLIPNIIQKHKELPRQTKVANHSLAYFVKMAFTLMDRGFVFTEIAAYMENFTPGDPTTLHEFKFEFLQIVCSHEHFVPLSLPLMRKGMIKTFKDLKCDYTLSEEYRRNHYLAGLLLQEFKMALNQPREIRRQAIMIVRNQLAKHSFDDRYSTKTQQGRIAALYLPLISILLEQKQHFIDDPNSPSAPGQKIPHPKGDGIPGTPQTGHKTVSFDTPQRDSKVFAMIAGTDSTNLLSVQTTKPQMNGSVNSLASSTSSVDKIDRADRLDKIAGIAGVPVIKDRKPDRSVIRNGGERGGGDTASISSKTTSAILLKYQKLDIVEIKDILVCFLYVIKHLPDDILLGWFNNSSEYDIIDFFSFLELCMKHFRYQGRKKIHDLSVIGDSRKALTMPAGRRSMPTSMGMGSRTLSQCSDIFTDTPSIGVSSSSDGAGVMRALQEANMSTEVGLVVLDILCIYSSTFKKTLEHKDGDNTLMRKVFDLQLQFLQTSQSEHLQSHVFAAWRSFIRKFPSALFKGNASLCGSLCYELLKCCNSKLTSTRKSACALLYLLMRSNFEFAKKKGFTRVHLQVIISVSQLIGDVVGLSNSRFQESLAMINSYASSDKAMQTDFHVARRFFGGAKVEMRTKSGFPAEVKDLTKKIRTVLMATSQMKEHENDPEMLIDLQYSLAKSYASTPELRKTWLDSMAKIHNRYGNYSEAAHCYIHIAALVAEYLKRRGSFPQGCVAFSSISPNIEKEESGIKDDSGMQDVQYIEETMVEFLEQAARSLETAERYEVLGEVYKLITPIYECTRDFEKLALSYQSLSQAYTKVGEVVLSGRRLLGTYFRVSFFGQEYFEEEDKEYIYKEPKVTSLPEICDRLHSMYGAKYGKDNVKLIKDSNKVTPIELDTKYAYIQVTHVIPYFEDRELTNRITEFERNNNIKRFMYETPFTKGGKARGEIEEQCKRRTILTTEHSFPFVKKRIGVVERQEVVLQPIEVAIDEMQSKVIDMKEVVNLPHPDIKKLQLKLQGSVSAQVNAGPLAYAQAFLSSKKVGNSAPDKVNALRDVFRDFVNVCNEALDLNATLITTEQKEYHESLTTGFQDIINKLSDIFGEKILTSEMSGISQRGSMTVFNLSVTSTGSSNV